MTNSLATSRSISCRRASHAMYWSQIREMEMSWISILFLPSRYRIRSRGPSKSCISSSDLLRTTFSSLNTGFCKPFTSTKNQGQQGTVNAQDAPGDQTAADAHKGQHQQHDNAVPLIPHQRDVLPVRQKRRQHLGPIQRRDGNQIEQPQTDGQRRQRVQAEAEHHVHRPQNKGCKGKSPY